MVTSWLTLRDGGGGDEADTLIGCIVCPTGNDVTQKGANHLPEADDCQWENTN